MDSESLPYVPTLQERLQFFRICSAIVIIELCVRIKELYMRLPQDYLEELDYDHRIICLRASLVCWSVTGGCYVMRKMQLQTVLSGRLRRDGFIYAGTGSGKTLPMAILILLDNPLDGLVTITVSPLKQLQASQLLEFILRFGINTIAINDDTPRDDAWWAKNVYSKKTPLKSPVPHLIVTVEQLCHTPEGHMPRMGELLRSYPYQKLITRINIDEAHFLTENIESFRGILKW